MNLATLWAELERRAPEGREGRMVQRIHPESAADIYAAVEVHPASDRNRRTLELHAAAELLHELDPPRGTRQVEVGVEARQGRAALVLGLEDPEAQELFAALCTDVAATAACHTNEADAVAAWVGRFAKWQRMLQSSPQGLSARRQRGLYAELLTLRDHLLPSVGFDEAILSWRGPDGAPRDCELRGLGVEVKSSAANEPQVVPVHGERQLDGHGLQCLLLMHHSLEVLRDAGETLPAAVAEMRSQGAGCAETGTFEDRLLQSGYADLHAPLYRRTGYESRRMSLFEVRDGFPRIIEDDLRDGVGSVRYSLAIEACRDFEVDLSRLTDRLEQSP